MSPLACLQALFKASCWARQGLTSDSNLLCIPPSGKKVHTPHVLALARHLPCVYLSTWFLTHVTCQRWFVILVSIPLFHTPLYIPTSQGKPCSWHTCHPHTSLLVFSLLPSCWPAIGGKHPSPAQHTPATPATGPPCFQTSESTRMKICLHPVWQNIYVS